jgi:DME family drug/metabolite transporter
VTAGRGRAALLVIASGLLFGTTGTATVLAGTDASATSIAAARLLVGAIGLVVVAAGQREWAHLIALWRRPLTWAMGLGVAGYMAFFFIAVSLGGVAVASLVSISLSPFLTGTIARLFGSPWPGRVWLASTVLAISGVVLLSSPGTGVSDHRLLGAAAAALASAAYALYTVLGSRLVAASHHATDTLAASFSIGALLLLPLLFVDTAWLAHPRGITLALWLGIMTTTLSYTMFGYGLTHLPPGIVATLVLSEPVVATMLGVFVLDESMPARGWLGCAMIAIGLALVARNESKGNIHV